MDVHWMIYKLGQVEKEKTMDENRVKWERRIPK
jgi:hypothetical protein